MKKILTLMMTLVLVLSLAVCGSTEIHDATDPVESVVSTERKPETITVKALNTNKELINVEVPYDPQRIAILDMPALDIVDALGVGDLVVGSAKVTIDYLTRNNPDDSNGAIMNLGTVKTADLEKVALISSLSAAVSAPCMGTWKQLLPLSIWRKRCRRKHKGQCSDHCLYLWTGEQSGCLLHRFPAPY